MGQIPSTENIRHSPSSQTQPQINPRPEKYFQKNTTYCDESRGCQESKDINVQNITFYDEINEENNHETNREQNSIKTNKETLSFHGLNTNSTYFKKVYRDNDVLKKFSPSYRSFFMNDFDFFVFSNLNENQHNSLEKKDQVEEVASQKGAEYEGRSTVHTLFQEEDTQEESSLIEKAQSPTQLSQTNTHTSSLSSRLMTITSTESLNNNNTQISHHLPKKIPKTAPKSSIISAETSPSLDQPNSPELSRSVQQFGSIPSSTSSINGNETGVIVIGGTGGGMNDGYRWRKYGRKKVKNSLSPRSYYKCTHPGCSVKKQVETTLNQNNQPVLTIIYKGTHSHDPPPVTRLNVQDQASFKNSVLSEFHCQSSEQLTDSPNSTQPSSPNIPFLPSSSSSPPTSPPLPSLSPSFLSLSNGSPPLESLSNPELSSVTKPSQTKLLRETNISGLQPMEEVSVSSHIQTEGTMFEKDLSNSNYSPTENGFPIHVTEVETIPKSQTKIQSSMEPPHTFEHSSNIINLGINNHGGSGGATNPHVPKLVVETNVNVDHLDDGYHWRKYGQKKVKRSPYPRSYYKCTEPGCPVKKQVELSGTTILNTYEGKHTHSAPSPIHHQHSSHSTQPHTISIPSNNNLLVHSYEVQNTQPGRLTRNDTEKSLLTDIRNSVPSNEHLRNQTNRTKANPRKRTKKGLDSNTSNMDPNQLQTLPIPLPLYPVFESPETKDPNSRLKNESGNVGTSNNQYQTHRPNIITPARITVHPQTTVSHNNSNNNIWYGEETIGGVERFSEPLESLVNPNSKKRVRVEEDFEGFVHANETLCTPQLSPESLK